MRALVRAGLRIVTLSALSALLTACLMRFAPGFDTPEEMLDARRSAAGVEAVQSQRRALFQDFGSILSGYARLDFGQSVVLRRPVRELLSERAGSTLRPVAGGLALSWAICLLALAWSRTRAAALWCSGLGQCLPAGLIGIALLAWGAKGPALLAAAIAAVAVPQLTRQADGILTGLGNQPWALAARARGVSPQRLYWRHVLPAAGRPLAALASVSVAVGLSAAIPLEMVLDTPGLGQLAWIAALGRDLPVLAALTFWTTLTVVSGGVAAEALGKAA
jgi:peptide/nickel transport system permease protein